MCLSCGNAHTCTHIHTPHTHSHPHTCTHTHSGGTNYTITGTGLDSVQQPCLLFYVDGAAGEGRTRRQTAGRIMNYIQSEVSMKCAHCDTTPRYIYPPPLSLPITYCVFFIFQPCTLDTNNHTRMQCPTPRILFTNSSMGQASLGLLMDCVTDLLMINATVTILQDPSFSMFRDTLDFTQNENIELAIQVTYHVSSCELM